MNAIYKVIWNDALRLYQVVNEMCRSRRKGCSVKAVHVQEHSVTESLKRGALIAGSALSLMVAAMPAWAYELDGLQLNMGGAMVTNEPTIAAELLPDGEQIVLDLDSTIFNNINGFLFSQDDGPLMTLFTVDGDWSGNNVELVFKQNGQIITGNTFTQLVPGQASYTYEMTGFKGGRGYIASYQLQSIDLLNDQGAGLYFDVSDNTNDDFKATLHGAGNITFGYATENQDGYLTIAGTGTNDYTGRTFVGYSADGNVSASKATIYFGKTEAFGQTLNLDVESASSVHIGGKNDDQAYEQSVHGLQGKGLIALGAQGKLHLGQSGTGTGNYDATEGVIRIDNELTGGSSAWFDIKLSGAVEDKTVRFSHAVSEDDASQYHGVISLTDGVIEAYDPERQLELDGGTYNPNQILQTSTLRLESGGRLTVDGDGSVNHLVLNNTNGWSADSGASNSNALSFENIKLGTGGLFVSGNLTLEQDATVNVDSFAAGAFEGAVDGKSFFDADDGLSNVLIEVDGTVTANGHKLSLTGEATGDSGTAVEQGGETVANAKWDFTDDLLYVESTDDKNASFNIEYVLKEVDIVNGKTFTLETESASEGQDFTALISGTGDLAVNAPNAEVTIGHTGGNTFTGDTTIADNTNVILSANGALGISGQGTLTIGASGSVSLADGVKQSGSGLSGTGALVLGSGAEYSLNQSASATINNQISGTGTLSVNLGGIGNVLEFGSKNAFSGTLNLSNASLNLSKNADALSTSHIVLNNDTSFTFGKGSHVAGLDINGNADINADTLILGGDSVLTVDGALTFDSGRTFDINDIEVADNINLADFDSDNGAVPNNFIEADSFTPVAGQQFGVNVSGATTVDGKQQVVRDYTQGVGNTVAQTTWLIDPNLTAGNNALKAGVQLTAINILNGKNLTITGDASGKTLSALLSSESASGSVVFTGGNITVSNSSNDYSVGTVVQNNTTVTLGASNALGKTSELGVYGDLIVGGGLSQTVYGWDENAGGLITVNGTLSLDQTGAVSIANTFSGNGIFDVDLRGATNTLDFVNGSVFANYNGTLSLHNLSFDVAGNVNYSSMLQSTDVVLNDGATFNADAAGSIHTGDFTFNGGTLLIGGVTAGSASDAKLEVSGGISIDKASQITLEGVELQGTDNILAADAGVKQTIAHFTADAVSGNLSDLAVTGAGESAIRNEGSETTVAWGIWNPGSVVSGNHTIDVNLTLKEIQLADSGTGLILDATGLDASDDSTIDALISNHDNTAGKIVFAGGNITIGGTGNTFTGETAVTGGTVTLATDSGFGTTSKLSIASGAAVQFGTHNQTVGALEVGTTASNAQNSIAGTGTLTLGTSTAANGTSHIFGTNDFSGTVALDAGHTLVLNDAAGLGAGATVQFDSDSSTVLTLSGANGGTFATKLSGDGTVNLTGSTNIAITGSNADYTGDWNLSNGSTATVSGTASISADDMLGKSGLVTLSGATDKLTLSQAGDDFSVDNVFAGAGVLEVLGTGTNQAFSFGNQWSNPSGFTGTMAIGNGLLMTVGSSAGAASNNAHNLANADFIVSGGSVLTVETGTAAVDTFDKLTIDSGTVALQGTLGFGAATNELAQLVVGSLDAQQGATLNVSMPGQNGNLTGSLAQTDLLTQNGSNPFQTLISTTEGITGFENLQLSGGNSGSGLLQDIVSGNTTVATGHYDYELASGNGGKDVGISYTLTQVDIEDNRTLTLTGTADGSTLSAALTGSTSGELIVDGTKGSKVSLTGTNTYSGSTTVNAGVTLEAGVSGLGHTENLLVSGTYVNSGANTIGGLTVDQNGELDLGAAGTVLTIAETDEAESSVINGTLTGSGTLHLANDGVGLTINSSNAAFGGTLIIGSGANTGITTITQASALGSGTVVFGSSGSKYSVDLNEAATIQNTFSGSGTILVDLGSSGNAFTFGKDSTALTEGSDLNLSNVAYSFESGANAGMASKLDITVGQGAVLSNKGDQDRNLHGLTLDGGLVDFGILDDHTGQFNLGGGNLTISSETKVAFDTPDTTETGDREITTGQNLLSGGLFDLTLVSGIGNFSGALGTVDDEGNQLVSGLITDDSFSGSHELLLQDVDSDGANEEVANLYRDKGQFYYNDIDKELTVEYEVRVIDLLHDVDDQGLTINVAGMADPAVLTAQVTGSGNIVFEGGELTIGEAGETQDHNSYTGKTYVRDNAIVTIAEDSGFGTTAELNIADGSIVNVVGAGLKQTVGSLTNTGTLNLGQSSTFTIDHSLLGETAAGNIAIATVVNGSTGAEFAIDGAYGTSGKAALDFADNNASNLSGSTFHLSNVLMTANGTNDKNYQIASTASDFVLDSGTVFTVNAANAGTGYEFLNELSFQNSGSISVINTTLTTEETDAVIHVGTLDLTGEGTLSVSAEITDSFNLLEDDGKTFKQTVIAYDKLTGGSDTKNLKPSGEPAPSELRDGSDVVAYVTWSGDTEFVSGTGTSGSVVMAYQVDELQLAQETTDGQIGGGLKIQADASTTDKVLSATIVDYKEDQRGTISFTGGDIRIGGTGTNTYTGKTFVTDGSVTLDKANGFGQTQLLSITGGFVDLNGQAQAVGALQITDAASIAGTGTLTLGSTDYQNLVSNVSGSKSSGFTGNVILSNNHTLELASAAGLGTTGQFQFADADSEILITDDKDGELGKTLSGGGSVTLSSAAVMATADNSKYSGTWTLSGGSILKVDSNNGITADNKLGTGLIKLESDEETLDITLGTGVGTLDNVVSGTGHVIVTGADEAFNMTGNWTNFTGVFTRTSGNMIVSAVEGSSGAQNAKNLAKSDYEAGAGSWLVVESGGTVHTFQNLTFNGGNIAFRDFLSIRPDEDDKFSALKIDGTLTVVEGQTADIDLEIHSGSGYRTDDTLSENRVVDSANNDAFLTLIDGQSGIVDVNQWTLNGSSNAATIKQSIMSGKYHVADAIYSFQLANGSDKTDLGILFDMTEIIVEPGMALSLSETGTLGVIISGDGGLTVTNKGGLTLTNSGNAYHGATTVTGTLTAGASGLGNTSALIVEGSYINSGSNTVGALEVDGSLTLNDTTTLTVTGGADNTIGSTATVSGKGELELTGGELTVQSTAANTSGFTGTVSVASGVDLTLETTGSSAGLGAGVIKTVAGADVQVTGSSASTLTNTVEGAGALTVNLGNADNLFRFDGDQSDSGFTGTLNLTSGTIDLTEDDVLQGATLATTSDSVIIVNDSESTADRTIGNLTLAGGVLDFGMIDTTKPTAGQIYVNGQLLLSDSEQATVKVDFGDLADGNGQSAFGTDQKLYLIEGYQNQVTNAESHFILADGTKDEIRQTVTQHDDDVADLVYSNGKFGSDDDGIYVGWDLEQIDLTSNESGGFIVSAAGEDEESGTITAQITGSGDVTFAHGQVTIAGSLSNDYSGATFVSGANVVLAKDEALGNTSALEVTAGSVAFGTTQQAIGSLNVSAENGFSMSAGGRVELGDNSLIEAANNGVASGATVAIANGDSVLTLKNVDALGLADIELGQGTTLALSGVAGDAADTPAVFDNKIAGSNAAQGTVSINSGSSVELTSTANNFDDLHVDETSDVLVQNMQADATALGNAQLRVDAGGSATLTGTTGWELSNTLNIAQGAELAISAGSSGNAFNFAGTAAQTINGTVVLSDALLQIGGASGSGNAAALDTATLAASNGANVHVAKGLDSQKLAGLNLKGGNIFFEGTLGIGADTQTLGQLSVESLELTSGTIHATASQDAASGGHIDSDSVIQAQSSGFYQQLIGITGDQKLEQTDLANVDLLVTDAATGLEATGIVSDIEDPDGKVAEGTYDYVLGIDKNGQSLGVSYTLTEINLIKTLDIEEEGEMTARLTGTGNLSVSNALTLKERTEVNGFNDFTGTTTVTGTGTLTAEANTLGTEDAHTSVLNVNASGTFTNAGDNVVGSIDVAGTMKLDKGNTLVVKGGDSNAISGTVSGFGSLNLEAGKLSIDSNATAEGYSGAITLGTVGGSGAILSIDNLAGFGAGTIGFANAASALSLDNLTGNKQLTNLVSGVGTISVTGTGTDATFGFRQDQTALAEGTDVDLSGINYNLAKQGSDVFANASLSLTSGTLTVNDGTSSYADRTIAGLTLNNGEVDFGAMGGDTQKGVINLAGNELVVGEDGATFKLNAELDDLTSNDGAAALTTGESITLVTDASTGNTTGIKVIVGDDANSYSQAIYQQHAQEDTASVHAYLTGTADSGMTATDADQDGDFDLSVGLNHKALEIVDEYVVSKDGELSLKVTDHDLQASAGGLTVSGAQLTLSNEENNYHGATKVEAGAALTLGADTALGNTSELNVDDQSSVAFGGYDQTIGKIDSSGVLTSTDGEGNTLTITNGGRASGTNDDFHMNVVLNGSENLVLEGALALGDGSVTISSADTDLVLNGIGTAETAVEYANNVGGSGGVTVSGNSNVLLTGTNDFAGGLTIEKNSTVNAEGDIYSHIGSRALALAGTANFTLTAQSTGDWDWDRKVTDAGTLHLDRADGAASGGDLVLTADSIKDFSGDLSLENWSIALNETSTTFNALKGSQASLTLGAGANAEVTGDIALNGKTVTVGNGGSLTFTGVAAPGGDNDDASTLTVGELHLDDGFVIDLGVADPNVKADQLLTQDDAGGTDVKVATATNGISGDLSSGHVSVNGSTVSEDDTIRFNVVQTSTEEAKNGTVAEGIYGVKFEKTSGETADEKNLVVNYKLAGVEILGDKTLVMDGDGADETHGNTFTGFIKGSGNLEIAGDAVYLTNNTNSFTGTTTVVAGASLHAAAGALGSETASTASLNVSGAGTAYITGNNTVEGLQIAQSGKLVLGDEKTAVPEDPVTLTLKSDVTAGSRLDGNLVGNGTLMVVGSGDVYDINKADLTIVGAQGDFYGDLVLDKRAWIDLTTTGTNIFGNSSADASNQIKVSKDSLLTIHSTNALGSIFGGVFADGAGEHGGRVEITLADSSLGFMFSTKQNEAGFTGTIALQKGTIALDNLFSDALPEGSAVKALADATLELGADGRAVLNSAIGGNTGSYDAHLGGLTMKGGSIEFGSINYDAGDDSAASGAHASHIDLGGDGILDLYAPVKDEESGNIVTQSTITIAQNETNTLSSSGTEMLAADDGTSIVLIHGIGKLYANGVNVTDRAEEYGQILNDYLHLVNDAEGTQLLEQEVSIDGSGSVVDVAEVVRTFDDELTFGHLSKDSTDYAVSLGYKVDQVGLLYATDAITSADISAGAYSNGNLWQGLTITTSDKEERNVFQAAIVDGNNGAATGNLVLRGNGKGDVLTIAGNNTYHGKTWLKDGAQIAFGIDNAFGNTQALRIDDTSSVDLGTHSQTVDMLFALGDNAIQGAEGSKLTVSNEAVIKGANANFAGDINLNGATTINNVAGLGTGTAALGSGVTLTIDGAEGDMLNSAISGGTNTSIAIENQAAVAINDGQIDDYEGSFLVADDSSLAVSTVSGGIFEFNNLNTKIEGELIIENAQFTIPKPVQTGNQKYSILQGAELTVDDNGEIVVSHAVDSNQVTDLALNHGSTITFDGGATPGVTNPDQGHIDLGGGNLAIKGDVTVKVDMGSYVNADMVEEAQEVANLPLTATDLVADKTDMILSNLVSGDLPDNFTDGEGNDYRLTLETTGADYADGKLNVGIYNDASDKDVVATGTYDYKVSLTDEGENEGLNLSYGLVGVELHKTLTLKGYEDEAFDNELGVAVTGKGGLKIASGTVSITGKNSYEGATTVQAGATLNTNSYGGSLGSASKHTSKLELVSAAEDASTTGAIANIRGSETVGALAMGEGTTLNLGAEAGGTSGEHVVFTIDSTVNDSHSNVAGNLVGGSDTTLAVIGDGKSDRADLTIKSANRDFLGDIHLTGAHVKLESLNSLGVSGTVVFDEDSTVEISSSSNEGTTSDNHYGEGVERNVHIFQNLLVGDGTLRVTLDNADDYFDFDARQYTYEDPDKQNFTGTMELVSGIFKFTEKNATVLQSVEVVLDENGTLDISGQPGNTVDRTIRGLTLVGGTLEFGSLSIDRVNTEAMSAHVDLMENDLKLADPEKKVQISFDQNAANNLSATGSEIVNASDEDGSKIVLIHNIGDLKVIENGEERVFGSNDRLDDYMQLDLSDTNEKQTLKQALTTNPDGELVDVATVHRNFGSFGYEDLADVDLGNAVYVDYQINSIELIHTTTDADAGDKRWEGLTVSTSEAANNLGAHLSGAGNLVIAEGTGNKPLFIGSTKPESEQNEYEGRTWVQAGADVAFAADNAFGKTSALRVDAGATVDLNGHSQIVGDLFIYGDDSLVGAAGSTLKVTGTSEISGTSRYEGEILFDSKDAVTGFVTEVEGLGTSMSIGDKYTLEVTDQTKTEGADTVQLSSNLKDGESGGGVLSIGSSTTSGNVPIELTGDNSGFSGLIQVNDGWSLAATVNGDEDLADRLGKGELQLVSDAEAVIDFENSGDVAWNHVVTGGGNLVVSTDSGYAVDFTGGLDNFKGTVTVAGGNFDLAAHSGKLGGAESFVATGADSHVEVKGENVHFDKDVIVENGASLGFEKPLDLSQTEEPLLTVDGDIIIGANAQVNINVDGELEVGETPDAPLDTSVITMADEGKLEYVIAAVNEDAAPTGQVSVNSSADLVLNMNGESGSGTTTASIDITDGGKTVATGKYDFDLAASVDRKELGISYHLTEVDVHKGETLRLAGAVSGATSSEDWDNASVLRADITDTEGNGSVALVEGELKLTGGHNTYHGTTTVGNGSSEAVLTVGEGSSLGNTSTVTVNGNAALVNESVLTKAQNIVVDEAGALNLSAWRETSGLQKVSRLELTSGKSVVNGTFIGEGDLALTNKATFDVNNLSDYEYTGNVSVGEEARFALNATGGTTVEVHNNFEALPDADAGTVAFTGNGATFKLEGHSVDFKSGTFSLGDNVTISASNINALGGEDSTMTITTEGKDDEATVLFNYAEEKSNRYVTMTQTMTSGITFEKTGDGVLELSDNAMGAGAVKVEEGGAFFGEAGQTDAFDTDLTVGEDGWVAGFGGVGTLTVERGGSFYVGGRAGYNSLLSNGVATLAEGDEAGEAADDGKTVSFTVNGDVNNKGVIYVGSKTDDGAAPADSSYIGNELVIKGDYNVTASDNGGIFDMNAVIAGNDKSSADHVTITGKINGEGYIDVNYDETASTGGELEYLGLVSVNGGDDGESLKLKDKIKIGDLWYRLMWSSDENEYYLQSSVTDPGDGSWDTEDVENVGGGARSALALMQVQTFDLSIHDHIGETLYVDPVTGEERKTTFWMIQRGDWTKFDNASGQLNADGHVYTTHLGSDLITRNTDNGTVRWGLLGSFADGDFDISSSLDGKTAQGSFRGYSVGGYWAFESSAESGPFAALQLRYNWFDNENGKDEYDVDGISITAEAGYDKLLSKGTTSSGRTYEWRVEPHVRAYWTNYGDPDDYTTPLGETYSSSFDNGMMVRVGARTKIASMKGTGPAVQAYAEANWVYNNGDYSTTVSTKYGDVTSTQEGANFAELRLGLEAQFTPKVNLWVEGHHQTGSDNYQSSGAMIGFKYRW